MRGWTLLAARCRGRRDAEAGVFLAQEFVNEMLGTRPGWDPLGTAVTERPERRAPGHRRGGHHSRLAQRGGRGNGRPARGRQWLDLHH